MTYYFWSLDSPFTDDVTHLMMPFEESDGDHVPNPDVEIRLHNEARLVEGIVGNGVELHGRGEYVTLGDQQKTCLGDLDSCENGLTMSFYLKPKRLLQDGYFVSGGPMSIYYKNGRMYAKFSTSTRTWVVSTDQVEEGEWQKLDFSWDKDKGLEMFINNERVSYSTDYTSHSPRRVRDHVLYLGQFMYSI